jgi:hypothetical protein
MVGSENLLPRIRNQAYFMRGFWGAGQIGAARGSQRIWVRFGGGRDEHPITG